MLAILFSYILKGKGIDVLLRKRFAALETVWRNGDSLNTPFPALIRVDDVKWLLVFRDTEFVFKQEQMLL